jgi:hypothetical protein
VTTYFYRSLIAALISLVVAYAPFAIAFGEFLLDGQRRWEAFANCVEHIAGGGLAVTMSSFLVYWEFKPEIRGGRIAGMLASITLVGGLGFAYVFVLAKGRKAEQLLVALSGGGWSSVALLVWLAVGTFFAVVTVLQVRRARDQFRLDSKN